MKILIDFTQIPILKVGVGVYAKESFSILFESIPSDTTYYLLLQDDEHMFDKFFSPNCIPLKINNRFFRKFPLRFIMEQLYIPYLIKKYKIDIIHSLHYSFPLLTSNCKKVITIHDLTFFIYPKLHTFIKRYYFKWFIKLACKSKNNTLICVSQSTANDLKKFITDIKSDTFVIPLAVSTTPSSNHNQMEVLEKYSIPSKYILFVGTLEPRKNIDKLIEAYYESSVKEIFKLVIVGKKGWYYESIFDRINDLKIANNVIFTGFVSEAEKWIILKNASLFVYPSLYEGFGLPVLEAMQSGTPTITSNISSMPEVAGDAALLIDPNDVSDISKAIDSVLTNQNNREVMIHSGFKQASLYSWSNTANLTHKIYRMISQCSSLS